ncbi:hypothetical protein JX265_013237 [Neoarthrinium moseri]|uniref:Uncharacterized protein n=1 Tax=Neoarthrinium moseri TaxID=1658444 RepID=A0A9P9W8V9_9PEZI|nr:hypothetical protein JX265_013237 [Neoarthrinium moseri]
MLKLWFAQDCEPLWCLSAIFFHVHTIRPHQPLLDASLDFTIQTAYLMLSHTRRGYATGCFALALTILILFPTDRLNRASYHPTQAPGNSVAQDTACQIWTDWVAPAISHHHLDQSKRPILGDAAVFGKADQCSSSRSRLDVYMHSQHHNFTKVKWGQLQHRCASGGHGPTEGYLNNVREIWQQPPKFTSTEEEDERNHHSNQRERTAIVLRTWDNYQYTEARLVWLRALISETSLHSHGHFQVFFLVNIKDGNMQLEEDTVAYEQLLQQSVPMEFRDMALLYNERTLRKWYPKVEEHRAQDQMYQALQIFSHQFAQFDFIWQLEMDLRVTGHMYDTLTSATAFAVDQPRRNLWSRNGRFYLPELFDYSYQKFAISVDSEQSSSEVWGPVHTTDFTPKGPPVRTKEDSTWGVGEQADLISFMPLIDPIGTDWIYEDSVQGFADGLATPRRASFVSMTRSSRSLLRLVHQAQRERGQWVVSEATLETFALLHGLKAVFVPHPVSFTSNITAQELDEAIHRGPQHSKAGGKSPSLLYTKHGYVDGPWPASSYWWSGNDAGKIWHAYLQGECLPPMFLHPVKDENS